MQASRPSSLGYDRSRSATLTKQAIRPRLANPEPQLADSRHSQNAYTAARRASTANRRASTLSQRWLDAGLAGCWGSVCSTATAPPGWCIGRSARHQSATRRSTHCQKTHQEPRAGSPLLSGLQAQRRQSHRQSHRSVAPRPPHGRPDSRSQRRSQRCSQRSTHRPSGASRPSGRSRAVDRRQRPTRSAKPEPATRQPPTSRVSHQQRRGRPLGQWFAAIQPAADSTTRQTSPDQRRPSQTGSHEQARPLASRHPNCRSTSQPDSAGSRRDGPHQPASKLILRDSQTEHWSQL